MLLSLSLSVASALAAPTAPIDPGALGTWVSLAVPAPAFHVSADPLVGVALDGRVRLPSRVGWLQPEARVAYARGVGIAVPGFAAEGHRIEGTFGARFGRDRGLYGGLGAGGGIGWGVDGLAPHYAFVTYAGYALPVAEHVRVSPELTVGTTNALSVRVEWGG